MDPNYQQDIPHVSPPASKFLAFPVGGVQVVGDPASALPRPRRAAPSVGESSHQIRNQIAMMMFACKKIGGAYIYIYIYFLYIDKYINIYMCIYIYMAIFSILERWLKKKPTCHSIFFIASSGFN